jgi:Flp pilus assembly pilin Flp/DNA-binding XRE family transcriptional regulator
MTQNACVYWREQLGLTQKDAAILLECSERQIKNYEREINPARISYSKSVIMSLYAIGESIPPTWPMYGYYITKGAINNAQEVLKVKRILNRVPKKARKFASSKNGVTSIEYALLALLISLCIVAGVRDVGGGLSHTYSTLATAIALSIPAGAQGNQCGNSGAHSQDKTDTKTGQPC